MVTDHDTGKVWQQKAIAEHTERVNDVVAAIRSSSANAEQLLDGMRSALALRDLSEPAGGLGDESLAALAEDVRRNVNSARVLDLKAVIARRAERAASHWRRAAPGMAFDDVAEIVNDLSTRDLLADLATIAPIVELNDALASMVADTHRGDIALLVHLFGVQRQTLAGLDDVRMRFAKTNRERWWWFLDLIRSGQFSV